MWLTVGFRMAAGANPNREREKKGAPPAPFSLSRQDGTDVPERPTITPEVMRKFGLRYGIEEWSPRRRER